MVVAVAVVGSGVVFVVIVPVFVIAAAVAV